MRKLGMLMGMSAHNAYPALAFDGNVGCHCYHLFHVGLGF